MSDEREQVEAAKEANPLWIRCPQCNADPGSRCHDRFIGTYEYTHHNMRIAAASRLPAPAVSQPVEAAQVESGNGPKMYISMKHYREILQKCLDGERAAARVEAIEEEIRQRTEQLQSSLAEIEQLKVLLRRADRQRFGKKEQ